MNISDSEAVHTFLINAITYNFQEKRKHKCIDLEKLHVVSVVGESFYL